MLGIDVMARQFRRPQPGETPTTGGEDELLAAPPDLGQRGSIEGYRAGRATRRLVYVTLGVGVVGAFFAARWYIGHLEERERAKAPTYAVDPATVEGRPRELEWSEGVARLGMSREPPGVQAIVLPDRILRLARGYDHAQVKVEVRDGQTVSVTVLVGQIVQVPRE